MHYARRQGDADMHEDRNEQPHIHRPVKTRAQVELMCSYRANPVIVKFYDASPVRMRFGRLQECQDYTDIPADPHRAR